MTLYLELCADAVSGNLLLYFAVSFLHSVFCSLISLFRLKTIFPVKEVVMS